MQAAVVTELGRPPEPGERSEPATDGGRVVIDVVAAPLNALDVAVGSGRYFAGHPPLPYVPGSEAVGRRGDSGALVWALGDGLGVQPTERR